MNIEMISEKISYLDYKAAKKSAKHDNDIITNLQELQAALALLCNRVSELEERLGQMEQQVNTFAITQLL